MASNREIRIHLTTALNAAGLNATREQMDSLASNLQRSMGGANKSMIRGWADFKAAADIAIKGIRAAWNGLRAVLSASFRFETQTRQFKFLIGSIDEARAHMADLKALGDTPPFNLDEFARASRQMMVMSDGVLGFKASMELVGDAAAATGNSLETVGHSVGRLYALIRDGQPISRAALELRNMGVLTPEVIARLDQMQKAGAANIDVWNEVTAALGRYKGAMAESERTGEGLLDAISSRWSNIVRAFGDVFSEVAKDGIGKLLDVAKELEEDGSIERWAENTKNAISTVGGAASTLSKRLSEFFGLGERNTQNTFMALLGGLGAGISGASEMGGGLRGFRKAQQAYLALHASNERIASGAAKRLSEMMRADGEWTDDMDIRELSRKTDAEEKADRIAEMRQRREERKKRDAEREAERERRHQELLETQMREAQERQDIEAARKAAEEYAKAEEKAALEAAKERDRLDRELHQKRMADIRAEMAAQNNTHSEMSKRASDAQAEFDRAFAMYRDRDLAERTIAEEQDYAADMKRLERDARRYGGKWRIDELAGLMSAGDTQGVQARLEQWRKSRSFSPEVEAMVRATAADRTRTTAEAELRKIEANTAGLADKLDELLAMKGA